MDRTRRLPPALFAHAQAFLSGDRLPVEPRAAATVVLLRPGASYDVSLEVYLLRRHLGMAFAAGMYAFPGGTVDARDADRGVPWAGPDAAAWSQLLRCSEAQARALVCAAVRETFEESGVLLAGETSTTLVEDTTGADWERERVALVDRSLSFTDFLLARRLVVRSDLLAAWAHWITPEFEPRRYDTRFFVAVLPSRQHTRDVSGEADTVAWMAPSRALAGVDDGSMLMLPPTYATLRELAGFATPADAWAASAERRIETVVPGVELLDGEAWLTLPPGMGG